MSKTTKSTFKSFINKNRENLFINKTSDFNGMSDMVESLDSKFKPIEVTTDSRNVDYDLGIQGIWLVGNSNDWFQPYEDNTFKGIEVSNSCGSFIVAIKKA